MLDRVLWLYFFTTPWFYLGGAEAELRLTFVDLMLPVGLALLLWARPSRTPWWLLSGVLLGPLALVSTVQNIAEPKFFGYLLKALRLAGVFLPALLICRLRVDDVRARRFARAFAWGGLISVALGIAGFALDWEWTRAIQTYDYGTGRLTGRAGGVFRDSGAYGHMVATWMAFFFALVWPDTRRWRWVLAAAVMGTGAVAIYASMSRAAVLDVLVMAAVQAVALLMRGRQLRYLAASAALVLLVAGFFHLATSLDFGSRLEDRGVRIFFDRFATIARGLTSDADSINAFTGNRLRSWSTCVALWLEHPLAGVGYKAAVPQYGVIPDNVYMMALLEMGGAGFILVSAMFGGFWMWSIGRAASGSRVALMVTVAWAGQIAHGFTADILTFPASISLAIAFAALAWRLEEHAPMRRKARWRSIPPRPGPVPVPYSRAATS
jgi:hypothetical protein